MSEVKLKTPFLRIFKDRIRENTRLIIKQCSSHNIHVAAVTKVLCAYKAVAEVFVQEGALMLADSRIDNLKKLKKMNLSVSLMMLRLPALSEVDDVVEVADVSLNSSVLTIKALSEAALKRGLVHKIILMVELGDLREGIMPDNLFNVFDSIIDLEGIIVSGMGCNLACYGGVKPSVKNMQNFVELVDQCRKKYKLCLPIVSGGNSSGLELMSQGLLPEQVNLYRLGESILLGRNVIDRTAWPGTRQDTLLAGAEVIESYVKPSVPYGDRGQDAFGNTPEFIDCGLIRRVICNIGRQDVDIDGLTPVDKSVRILGASSDHLILDVTKATVDYKPGDIIYFYPDYSAVLALSTSQYVHKELVEGD